MPFHFSCKLGVGIQAKILEGKLGEKQEIKVEKDPHLCLKCGTELARGRLSYKKRHWGQSHKGDKTDVYKRMIVPINHEKARSLLKERASKNQPLTSQSECQDDILETDAVSLSVREVEESDSHSEPGLDDSSQIELMELDNDSIHVDTACLSTVPDESAVSTSTTTTTTKSSMPSTLSSFVQHRLLLHKINGILYNYI